MGPRINLVFFPTVASANFGAFKSNKNMIFLRSSAVTVSMFPYLRKNWQTQSWTFALEKVHVLEFCVRSANLGCASGCVRMRYLLHGGYADFCFRVRQTKKRRARIVSGANCPWDPLSTIFVERCNVRNVNLRAEPAAKCLGQRE